MVMLPTDEKAKSGDLMKYPSGDIHIWNIGVTSNNFKHQLNILSDDEIKIGDWYFNFINKITWQKKTEAVGKNDKKIIASTDKTLNVLEIPEEFIKEYCKRGGVNEVMVGYKFQYNNLEHVAGCDEGYYSPETTGLNNKTLKSISFIKENYTREEVIELCTKAYNSHAPSWCSCYISIEDWIKKNIFQ